VGGGVGQVPDIKLRPRSDVVDLFGRLSLVSLKPTSHNTTYVTLVHNYIQI